MKNITRNQNYVDKIIEILSDSIEAIVFFEESNIVQVDEIQSIQKYDRNDGRKSLVITSKTKDPKSDSTKICIDVKEGLTSTEQLHEVIYGAGSDCDIRLIIFSTLKDEKEDKDPTADFNFVKDIVDVKNQYPLKIYLVNFFEPLENDNYFHYFVYAAPPENCKFSLDDIESELQFREGEFWIGIVNSKDKDFYKDWPLPDKRFEGLGHHIHFKNLRVKVAWNDQGSKIAVYQTDGKNDLVQDLFRRKKSELEKLFEGYKVDLEILEENQSMITVTISGRPVGWLLKSDLQEKMDFARVLHRNYGKMIDFIKEEI